MEVVGTANSPHILVPFGLCGEDLAGGGRSHPTVPHPTALDLAAPDSPDLTAAVGDSAFERRVTRRRCTAIQDDGIGVEFGPVVRS